MKIAHGHGVDIPNSLPLLDDPVIPRPANEAVNRLLVLNVVAAVSYGLNSEKAVAWLKQEHLDGQLTAAESAFVRRGSGNRQSFQIQIEAMWALAWALGMVPQLDFWRDCDSRFAALLPNLKANENSAKWYGDAKTRSMPELIAACDLAYCLHWAVRQSLLRNDDTSGVKALCGGGTPSGFGMVAQQ